MIDVGVAVGRPWGTYTVLHRGVGFQVKLLVVQPYSRLSLQSHAKRRECWTISKGSGLFTVGKSEIRGQVGGMIHVPLGMKHRIRNDTGSLLEIVEVQIGDPDEDDIVRYEDDYGRA